MQRLSKKVVTAGGVKMATRQCQTTQERARKGQTWHPAGEQVLTSRHRRSDEKKKGRAQPPPWGEGERKGRRHVKKEGKVRNLPL